MIWVHRVFWLLVQDVALFSVLRWYADVPIEGVAVVMFVWSWFIAVWGWRDA